MTSQKGGSGGGSGQTNKQWDNFVSGLNLPSASKNDKSKTPGIKVKSTKAKAGSNIFERDDPNDARVERLNRLWSTLVAARRDDRFDENETIDRGNQKQRPNHVIVNERLQNMMGGKNP